MSYSKDVKTKLFKIEEKSIYEKKEKLHGILRTAGTLGLSSNGISLEINSENELLIKKVQMLLKNIYDKSENDVSKNESVLGSEIFSIRILPPFSEKILSDIGLISIDENGEKAFNTSIGITKFENDAVAIAFIMGAFLGSGTVSVPEANGKELSSGYHLEMVFTNEAMADCVCHLLAEYNFTPKKIARRNAFVVYFKESGMLCDFFALIGANSVVMELNNIIAERDIRNLANRQRNCISANIDKAVDASMKQMAAIEIIEKTIGLEGLPDKLKVIAKLRKENPDYTMDEIREKLEEPVTKSGINHRFRKLLYIANELGGNLNDC